MKKLLIVILFVFFLNQIIFAADHSWSECADINGDGNADYKDYEVDINKGTLYSTTQGSVSHDTLYVTGTSKVGIKSIPWDNTYATLQEAIEIAEDGDEIWVASLGPESYKTTNKDGIILDKAIIIRGGFTGDLATEVPGEAVPQRDFISNETIISADIEGDDVPDFNNCENNGYHVFKVRNNQVILDGFTITGVFWNANYTDYKDSGGAIINVDCSPTITNCTFKYNAAWEGPAICNYYRSSPTIDKCIFQSNLSVTSAGAIYNHQLSNPVISNCFFIDNEAYNFDGGVNTPFFEQL